MNGTLYGLWEALPLGFAFSIASLGARPIIKRGGLLSLSLALYFAFGAYAAGWYWNRTIRPDATGSLVQIVAGLTAATLGATLLALPNLIALGRGLRGHFYGLFSLAYGFGLWSAIVNLRLFTNNFDGFTVGKPWPRAWVVLLVLVLLGATLAVVGWIERSWRGTSLDWLRQDVHDQAIYGINELRLIKTMELAASAAAGLAGACYTLLLLHPQREWGEPTSLILIVLATLLSTSSLWSTVLTSTVLIVIRPLISDLIHPAANLVLLGLALVMVSASRRWQQV